MDGGCVDLVVMDGDVMTREKKGLLVCVELHRCQLVLEKIRLDGGLC